MARPDDVVVTGVGAVTPLGTGVAAFRQAALDGRSGVVPITEFRTDDMPVRIGGMVRGLDVSGVLTPEQAGQSSRVVHLAMVAAAEAMGPNAASVVRDPHRVGVVMGVCSGGVEVFEQQLAQMWKTGHQDLAQGAMPQLMDSTTSSWMARKWGLRGPAYCFATACATGTDSLGLASDMIRAGRLDACLAGGGDAAVTRFVMSAFANARALSRNNDNPALASRPFDKDRDGFVMGEAAVVMLLERADHAQRRGARILARLAGYGSSNDAHHVTAPRPDGSGLAGAMGIALKNGSVGAKDVGYVSAHGTSTDQGDAAEAKALHLAFGGNLDGLQVGATKSLTGHALGGAGAVSSLAAVLAVSEGVLTPCISFRTPDPDCNLPVLAGKGVERRVNYALANAAGFGGHNSSVLFGAP